jgi:hypothetical protein
VQGLGVPTSIKYLYQHAGLHVTNISIASSFYMPGINHTLPYAYARCLQVSRRSNVSRVGPEAAKPFSQLSPLRRSESTNKIAEEDPTLIEAQILEKESKAQSSSASSPAGTVREPGAMSQRLAEATENALFEGGRAGRKAVEEAGFSEELKQKLLERVESHKFQSENARAFAEAGLIRSAGKGSRDIASAQAWTGSENPEDTMLRMLDDSRKYLKPGLRGSAKIPSPIVDLRLQPKPKQRPGQRLANARDKTSIYSISKDMQMSPEERDAMRKDLKERFTPAARAMPNSIRGLAALANERIEDAIARGQFKVGKI